MNSIIKYYLFLKNYTKKDFIFFFKISIFFHVFITILSLLCSPEENICRAGNCEKKILKIKVVNVKKIQNSKKDTAKSTSKKTTEEISKKNKKTTKSLAKQPKVLITPKKSPVLQPKPQPIDQIEKKGISEETIVKNTKLYEQLEQEALKYGRVSSINWKQGSEPRKRLYLPKVYYPKEYINKNIQATVKLQFYVSPLGEVNSIKILKSSGYSRLDISAKKTLRRAKFSKSNKTDIGFIIIHFTLQ